MYERHVLGKRGEDEATKYLKNKGYKILERNFMCKQGEIYIIALDKDYIVFVEIKSRTNDKYGLPSEAVTKQKIKHMKKAIEYFLYIRNLQDENIRVDVIEVYVEANIYRINHLKQII